MKGKRIPNSIEDTISYVVLELRYTLNVKEGEDILTYFYPIFSNEYKKFSPINKEIPELLKQKEQFKFLPEYRFMNDDFVIAIGRNAIQFEFIKQYDSWRDFSKEIFKNIEKVLKIDVIEKIIRIGLRYTNILETNFSELDIDFNFKFPSDENITLNSITNNYEFIYQGSNVNLKVASNAEVKRNLVNKIERGLLVDVDVYKTGEIPKDLKAIVSIIEDLHKKEKIIFFNTLTQEFIDSRNPKYD
jgi:uncharacterized protein (TIGR04255 family)